MLSINIPLIVCGKYNNVLRHGPKYSEMSVSNVAAQSQIPWPSNGRRGNNPAGVSSSTAQTPEITIGFLKV